MFTELDVQLGVDSEDQTDEIVYCNIPLGGGLYAGYMLGLASPQLFGQVSSDYGIYTAASKGGSRLNVLSVGTPGNGDVLFNPVTGRLVANQIRTVYVTYPFYGRIFRWWEMGPLTLAYPNIGHETVSDLLIYRSTLYYPEGFIGCIIDCVEGSSTAEDDDLTLDILKDDVSLETVALAPETTHTTEIFTNRIKFEAGSELTLEIKANTMSTPGNGLFIQLIRG